MIPLYLLMSAAFAARDYGDQIVTLSVTTQSWESGQPWMKTNPSRRFTQAVYVSEGGKDYLLTIAVAVENATLVRVKKHGEPDEVTASVQYVDRQASLALLTIEDKSFFSDMTPVRFTRRPINEGSVTISRWRENQLESAEGRIARAATFDSPTGSLGFVGLRVTTDLSSGGWSEPVFVGPTLVGLTIGQSKSELTVMPAAFIADWLEEVTQTGSVPTWVGQLGVQAQTIRSVALANWLGLEDVAGILVLGVQQGSSACGALKRGDVILAIDGLALDGNGNVQDPLYGLLSYEYLLSNHRAGGALSVTILRDHVRQTLSIPLRSYNSDSWLIPMDRLDPPPYLMAGGLVFREYDEAYNARAIELQMLAANRTGQTSDRQRIVVLASVLPDPYNIGYHSLGDLWVEQVNGQAVHNIADVAAAFAHPVDGYHVVTFHPNPRAAEVVLDAATFEAATLKIASAYGLPALYRPGTPPPDIGEGCE